MTPLTRRKALGAGAAAALLPALASAATAAAGGPGSAARPAATSGPTRVGSNPGPEGQRRADLGNGSFLNPIFPGDHPDPTILRDGDEYCMTFSSFDAAPGLTLWHSRDLVNWEPRVAALPNPPGSIYAVDLCKHGGRYFIYIPVYPSPVSVGLKAATIFVIHADSLAGPWSEPIRMAIEGYIDPGHIVGEDGKRYLFLNKGSRVRLSDDGLAVDGPIEKVYEGWRYPDDWITEAYALEGPKLFRRGEWFYLVSAVGGTAGPPTGHMVTVSRSRSIHGPWVHAPNNPMVRTRDASAPWWSRGHATIFEGPEGRWWMVYHGYENGYRTLGRQTLLDPVEWTADGWPKAAGGDLGRPLPMPRASARSDAGGLALSDDFRSLRMGSVWTFYRPSATEMQRIRHEPGQLVVHGKGSGPEDCSPLCVNVGDHGYEASVDVELRGAAKGGLLLFYSRRLHCGMCFDGVRMSTYRGGSDAEFWREAAPKVRRMQLKIVNDRHIVTMYYRVGDAPWQRHGLRMEVSGYHVNAADELTCLRPALVSAGSGEVVFRNFQYQALPASAGKS